MTKLTKALILRHTTRPKGWSPERLNMSFISDIVEDIIDYIRRGLMSLVL